DGAHRRALDSDGVHDSSPGACGAPSSIDAFLTGATDEHQHLSRANDGVVAYLVAVEDGQTLRVDVEPVAVARPDLAHRQVAHRQLLAVRAVRDGRHRRIARAGGKEVVQAPRARTECLARGSRLF